MSSTRLIVMACVCAHPQVSFKVHNNPAGFKLKKGSLAPTARTVKRLKFPLVEELMDASVQCQAEDVRHSNASQWAGLGCHRHCGRDHDHVHPFPPG